VPQTAPGLLAWNDGACDGGLNRRRDFDYPPATARGRDWSGGDEVSIDVAMVLRDGFAPEFPAALTLFDAPVEFVGRGALRLTRSQIPDEYCSAHFAMIRTSASVGFNGRFRLRVMSAVGRVRPATSPR
jgi:hypothetical protein